MSELEQMVYASTFAAAYVGEVSRLKRGEVEFDTDIAARACVVASEALRALRDIRAHGDPLLARNASAQHDFELFWRRPENRD
jgi:hypothetical protein